MFAIIESLQVAALAIRQDKAMVIMYGLEASKKSSLRIRGKASNVVLTV